MYKIITVKMAATLAREDDYIEYEFPLLKTYLEDNWSISNVHQASTEVNTGFVFLTFTLYK